MNIALIGFGKMGQEIKKIALERGHSVPLVIDIDNKNDLNTENLSKVDVAIEFTIPESAIGNYKACFDAGVPVVSGTTGWLDKYDDVEKMCADNKTGFFYASNYSLGVNLFFAVNAYVAKLMNKFPAYDVAMEEIHHTQKLDAPSGTAITLAEGVLENIDRKKKWTLQEFNDTSDLQIVAKRLGSVPGTHTLTYDSEVDSIELKHTAKSRKGFALGAVLAAEFMENKQGVFGMKDLLGL
ncbi:MAG: 4-hydroxy-tetrahydrodipicolinate reductase [Bacteroidales bacterium]